MTRKCLRGLAGLLCATLAPGAASLADAASFTKVEAESATQTGSDEAAPAAAEEAAAIERSCQERKRFASRRSDTPARLTFINASGKSRRVSWIDFNGATRTQSILAPGERIERETFLTHPWVVADAAGNCLKVVLPSAAASVVTLEADGAGEEPVPERPAAHTQRPRSASLCGKGRMGIGYSCR